MLTKEKIIGQLRTVRDPEIGLDVWSLKLVYDVQIRKGNNVFIKMTLTSPACPYGGMMIESVKQACLKAGAKTADVDLTFGKPWTPPDEIKWTLGIVGP
jgi:metal-sulfur cluster biosynthetic enzyme